MAIKTQLRLLAEDDKRAAEDQIKIVQREIDYNVKDFTIDYLVQRFQEGLFYIPDYQRRFIWKESNKVKFIESVILGLPIPFMFVADVEDGRLEVVDGAQRIQTLEQFVSEDLILEKLTKLDRLNGFAFSNLSEPQRRKFLNRALRIIVLEDTTTLEIRHEIFERINTSGEKAKPSEIRRGAHTGAFMDFVFECAKNPLLTKLCPLSKSLVDRREYEELVVRFFAYSDQYRKFRHDVEKFLDQFVIDHKNKFDRDKYLSEFQTMLAFVNKYFPHGFSKTEGSKSTPRVRFEAIAVGVNLALRENKNLVPGRAMGWLDSKDFAIHTTTHASNSNPRLSGRIEYVKNQLLGTYPT